MNGADRKIEIFAPFGAAIDLTKRILFQPFDLNKWFIIGFAAFLAGLGDGTHISGGNFSNPGSNWSWKSRSVSPDFAAAREHIAPWLIGSVAVVVGVAVLVAIVLFAWLGSRGRFMFIDCIVRNRGAIQEPWREYRREGNSLFVFALLIALLSICVIALLALPIVLPLLRHGNSDGIGAPGVIYPAIAVPLWFLAALAIGVTLWFVAPVMYRQRCTALEAFGRVWRLIAGQPVAFILFILFAIVLAIAGTMIACLVTCITCCIAALPYVGTVILLPLYTFYYAFTLLFLRQFGPDYDVWANVVTPPAAAALAPPSTPASSEPPPMQL